MATSDTPIHLLLVGDRPDRSRLLRDELRRAGIDGAIRCMPAGGQALDCARRVGSYRLQRSPDVIVFDYSVDDDYAADVLRQLAFGPNRSAVPVVLITSPRTLKPLLDGQFDGGQAIMFSPTPLTSFVRSLRQDNRPRFMKALRILYQYGPILVRAPQTVLEQDEIEAAMTA